MNQIKSKNKRLTEHFKKHLKAFRKKFSKASKSQGIRTIHNLRLSIKKLRAALTLAEIASKGAYQKKQHFELFDKLFKNAGAIREIQIHLSIVRRAKFSQSKKFKYHAASMLSKAILRFEKRIKRFDFKKLKQLDRALFATINTLPDEEVIFAGVKYIEEEYKLIRTSIIKCKAEPELHKKRIRMKTLLEVTIILRKLNDSAALKRFQKEVSALNKTMGEWHDHDAFLNFLKTSFKKTNKVQKHLQYPEKWMSKIRLQEESLRVPFLKQLTALMNKPLEIQRS